MSPDDSTAVTLARIEGKLDLLHAAISAAQSRGDDHEARLRILESKAIDPERVAALETKALDPERVAVLEARVTKGEASAISAERVRALEARPEGITPAKFLSTLVGMGSFAAALATVVTLLTR